MGRAGREKEKQRKRVEKDTEKFKEATQKLGIVENDAPADSEGAEVATRAYRLKDDEILKAAEGVWVSYFKDGNEYASLKDMGMQLLQGYRELFILSDGGEAGTVMFVDRIDRWAGMARLRFFSIAGEIDKGVIESGLTVCAEVLGLRKVWCEAGVDDSMKLVLINAGFVQEGEMVDAVKVDASPPSLTDLLVFGKEII